MFDIFIYNLSKLIILLYFNLLPVPSRRGVANLSGAIEF